MCHGIILQLVVLDLAAINTLPAYSQGMPIFLEHGVEWVRHTLGKTITLRVGQPRTFSFAVDNSGKAQCFIHRVWLIDVWESVEEQFRNLERLHTASGKDLQRAKSDCFQLLEETCPKGMCYVGVSYECSRDFSLQFYAKQYLASRPKAQTNHSDDLGMRIKLDQERGAHQLPLKACVIQTPVPATAQKIQAELLFYDEKKDAWTEQV